MSDHLVRLANLKEFQRKRAWTDAELARQTGRSQQQVRSWFLPTTDKNARLIGERLARDLEAKLGLSRYRLDDREAIAIAIEEPLPRYGGSAKSAESATSKAKETPVLRWGDLDTMLEFENLALRARAPHIETFAVASSKAKFLQMNDDSMEPEFSRSDHILFDPTEAPRAGDVVLVRIPSGDYFVRFFRPRTAHIFEAVALNIHYQALSSDADGAVVKAVMIEHRRYRKVRA